MAKAVILNATSYEVIFKGEWEVPPFGKDHAKKTVDPYGDGWIDTLWYDLDFSVITENRPYIQDNHGTVHGVQSYAYVVYCSEAGGVCCFQLECGDHLKLYDGPLEYKKRLKNTIDCLIKQIKTAAGELKKQLEEQLKKAQEAYSKMDSISAALLKTPRPTDES